MTFCVWSSVTTECWSSFLIRFWKVRRPPIPVPYWVVKDQMRNSLIPSGYMGQLTDGNGMLNKPTWKNSYKHMLKIYDTLTWRRRGESTITKSPSASQNATGERERGVLQLWRNEDCIQDASDVRLQLVFFLYGDMLYRSSSVREKKKQRSSLSCSLFPFRQHMLSPLVSLANCCHVFFAWLTHSVEIEELCRVPYIPS